MELGILIATLFVLLVLRVPVAFALILSSIVVLYRLGLPFEIVVTQTFSNIQSFTLLAIPFFLLLGRLLNEGAITERLVDFADAVVGHIRGGLGHINVFVSMIFGCFSGSTAADTASIGSVMIPTMLKAGYHAPYTVAITAASSTLGTIIPPSIIMVIYGAFGQISIGALFLSGIVPGFMVGIGQMGYTYYIALKYGYGANPRRSLPEMGRSFLNTSPALMIAVIILGGILSGLFTATEAAVIGAVYTLGLAIIGYRTLPVRQLPRVLYESVVDFAIPIFTIACAGIFGWLLAFLGADKLIADLILSYTDSYFGIFTSLIVFLLVLGTFFSAMTSVVIFMPIIQHLGNLAGIDPIHLGLSVIMALACAPFTPPYGLSLLLAAQIGHVKSGPAFLAAVPLVGITVGIIFVGMAFPDLFLFIPKTFIPTAFLN